jgi:hypothetical protein
VDPSTDSSMKLPRWWAVDELARTRLGSVAGDCHMGSG